MKRILSITLAGLMTMTVLSGCGTKEETVTTAPPTAVSETEAKTAEEMQSETVESTEGKAKLKIGFSELAINGAWRVAQVESMEKEAEARGYEFVMTNAEQDAAKQVSDVEDLLAQDVDFLFVSAVDVEAIMPALNAAKEQGVPVILLDREANGKTGEDFLTTIIADYKWQGEQCAEWVYKKLGDDTQIKAVEITGKVGGSDVRDRQAGFTEGAAKYDNFEIVASQTANWSRAEAQKVMQNIIQSTGGDFNVVYAHCDDMALGAILALKTAGMELNKDVYVVTIDGQKEAVESIIAGELSCIVTCSPRFGPAAFDAMEKYLKGEQLPATIINEETIIDSDNAEAELENAF